MQWSLKITAILILLFWVSPVIAQTRIHGFIRNEKGDTLPFATIKLKKDSAGPATQFAIASSKGFYEIICSSAYVPAFLEASAIGYLSRMVIVNREDTDLEINLSLIPLAGVLPEVIVKSEPPITVSGDTTSFRADAFKFGNESSIGNVLRNMPGFSIQQNGKIVFNGVPITRILIEGDDLTGKDYVNLTRNLDPAGIEHIQVIRNYSDAENISSSLREGSEQVLNLKYNKAFLGKLFGNAEGQLDPRLRYYNQKSQLTSLLKPFRLIALQEINSLGNIQLNEKKELTAMQHTEELTQQITLLPGSSFASIENLKSPYTDHDLIYENRTFQSSANFNSRISSKLSVKGSSGYTGDMYRQYSMSATTFYLPLQNLLILQVQDLKKKTSLFDNAISVNYLINSRNQLSFQAKARTSRPEHRSFDQLQNQPYSQYLNGKNDQCGAGMTYTTLLKKPGAFVTSITYQRNTIQGYFFLLPSNFDSLFYKVKYSSMLQEEYHKNSLFSASILFLKKLSNNVFSFKATARNSVYSFQNTISLYNTSGTAHYVHPDSTNDMIFRQQEITFRIQDDWTVNRKLSFTFFTGLLSFRYSKNDHKTPLQGARLIPGGSMNFELSTTNRLGLSIINENIAPGLKDISPGYILTGLTSIQRGYDSLQAKTSRSVNLFFSHIDLLKKGFLFFSQLSLIRRPFLYLPDQFPDQYYTILKFEPTNREISLFSFLISADKYVPGTKTKLSSRYTMTAGNSYNLLNRMESAIKFTQMNIEAGVQTQKGKIQFDGTGIYRLSIQNSKQPNAKKITASRLEFNTGINWKITSRIFWSTTIRHEWAFLPDQKAIGLLFGSSEMTFHSKNEKWQWGIRCNNLFDQSSYSYTGIYPNQTIFSQYRLVPRIILACIKYRF